MSWFMKKILFFVILSVNSCHELKVIAKHSYKKGVDGL